MGEGKIISFSEAAAAIESGRELSAQDAMYYGVGMYLFWDGDMDGLRERVFGKLGRHTIVRDGEKPYIVNTVTDPAIGREIMQGMRQFELDYPGAFDFHEHNLPDLRGRVWRVASRQGQQAWVEVTYKGKGELEEAMSFRIGTTPPPPNPRRHLRLVR